MKTLIKNAQIYDSIHREPYAGDLLIEDGKIAAIGAGLVCSEAEVFDAEGLRAYAGFIDAHSHLGLAGYGIGYEGTDYNEMNDIVTPQTISSPRTCAASTASSPCSPRWTTPPARA